MKQTRRPRLAGLIDGVALVATACAGAADPQSLESVSSTGTVVTEQSGDPIPSDTFQTFSGETVTLADYAGKPLVVNFWASWCPSCVVELTAAFLPAQLALGEEVDFLGVNIQDERQRALELVEETGVLFDLAEDSGGALYRALGGLGMPFTVFVSAVHNGPLTEDQLVNKITEALLS